MPTVNPSAFGPRPQWFDAAGNPDTSYKLFMYAAGSTSTKQNSYTNSTGSVANTNPIILNALGQTPNELWWDASLLYKVVLAPSTDTDPPTNPVWTVDNLQGMNSGASATATNEWVLYSASAIAFVSASSFTLVGNQTLTFHIGRRLQFMTSAGFVYGRITNSVFAASTTVTVQMDGAQVLDSGLSAIYYSILTANILALPERISTATGTNAYSATVGIANLVIGNEYKINFTNANTSLASPTLTLDVGAALPIFTQNGSIPLPGMIAGEIRIQYNGSAFIALNPVSTVSRGYIDGLILSTAGASITMALSSGQAADSTNSILLNITAFTKTTAAWAVGNANGGKLSAAAIANSIWYYWYLIRRPDTGVVDVGFDVSPTTPTLPSGYTQYRYIGASLTNGSVQWTSFKQYGDYFEWATMAADINVSDPGISAVLRTLSIPSRIVTANLAVNTGTNTNFFASFTNPATTDVVPSASSFTFNSSSGSVERTGLISVVTNSSKQIRTRQSASGASDSLIILTVGWTDPRGKNA